ncbi:MAG: ABC transporter ATP-binding protein [Pseudomonadota bacterium]
MDDPVLSARDVHVRFDTPAGQVHAVRGINLDLFPGETVAIVGESGAGKSAFAKAILHLHQVPFTPNRTHIEGTIALHVPFEATLLNAGPDIIRKARAQAVGMIFQDALSALNPVQRIGPQIAEAVRQAEPEASADVVTAKVLDIVDAIGLPAPAETIHAYPHQLSGGQCQRVVIAIAAVRHPVALIADEPTTALDVTVQAQILKLLKSLQDVRGMAMLFITHDLGVVADIADRVVVMRNGEVVELGDTHGVFTRPQHPYTRTLLASRPGSRAHGFVAAPIANQAQPSLPTAPMIRADAVSFSYGGGLFERKRSGFVLENASVQVEAGEVHGIVGESGSGKSTLGRLLLGFLQPSAGKIDVCGETPHAVRGDAHRAFRRNVQVIYQDSATALNPRMTLGRSAAEGLEIHGQTVADARSEVRHLFDLVRLPAAHLERFPHEVSGGQRQRVCIARALATKPKLLIADEPVTALDVSVQARILELFAELQADLGLTMLFISHDLGVIRELCSRVSVMHQGRVVEGGPTENVLDNPQTDYARTLVSSLPTRAWA